jgi:hypothetical protein
MQELPRRMVEGRTTHQCIMVRLVSLGETGGRESDPISSCGSESRWRRLARASGQLVGAMDLLP